MVIQVTTVDSGLAILQVIIAIFTMIYSYDVLVLHRKFKEFGEILAKYARFLTFGVFITVTAFAVDSFGKFHLYVNIAEAVGILILGLYFRKCMHEFFTKPVHVRR